MKELIDITDEDLLKVIDRIYVLTENEIVSRNGILGLDFKESFRKYGRASIDIYRISRGTITDGYYTTESRSKVVFHHKSIWFAELGIDGKDSNYNKNHFCGYLKLQELGYKLPTEPQL